jgi:hypothetical protein
MHPHYNDSAGGVCKFAGASAMIAGAFDSLISGTHEPELAAQFAFGAR